MKPKLFICDHAKSKRCPLKSKCVHFKKHKLNIMVENPCSVGKCLGEGFVFDVKCVEVKHVR